MMPILRALSRAAVHACMMNAGQVCAAPTRLLVPQARFAEVADTGSGSGAGHGGRRAG